MSRLRSPLGRVVAALALGVTLTGVAACEEESQGPPARCLDPALPLFDPAHAGAPSDDNARYAGDDPDHPCVTLVGHGVSYVGDAPTGGTTSTAGTAGTTSDPGGGGADTGSGGAGGEGGGEG